MLRIRNNVALVAALCLAASPVFADGYFIPGQHRKEEHHRVREAPRMIAPPMSEQAQQEKPLPQIPLPPVPNLPPLPKGSPPPAPVIGVLGVPEVMRASTAAQEVERVIGERRQKLSQDAQKEQQAWRDMQQSLQQSASKLSNAQIQARQKALQDRITNAQKQFRDRNRVIQMAAQVSLGQIERTLIGVIRQVAESRGMNLVLHRGQVALNVNGFDITEAVTKQLNKILPEVNIPPDGKMPTAADAKLPESVIAAEVPAASSDKTLPGPRADKHDDKH